jgi:methylthioribulose-1-phosphate dehydratase
MAESKSFKRTASAIAAVGQRFYTRGWALGTSGNFSAVLSRKPLRLAITASSVAKGTLRAADILQCDGRGRVVGRPSRRPSAETLLHVEIARRRRAGAVLHTHSVWSTMLSEVWTSEPGAPGLAPDGPGLTIVGYEMLKGLSGVTSHEHREFIPILDNDQDMPRLAGRVGETLERFPEAHAFLLQRHGLYTWGDSLADAERHVEILEFLFEAVGRTQARSDGARAPGGPSWRF